jgi:hypothetical protein
MPGSRGPAAGKTSRYQDYSVTPSVLIVAVIGNEVRLVEPDGGQPVAHVTTSLNDR